MRAIRVHEYGDSNVLRLEDVPVPQPAEGEVLVKIAASGVNFIDIYHRTGLYPGKPPITLGVEGAGTVEAVGANVSEVKVGDRVGWVLKQGSYAEYATVPAAQTIPIPDGITLETAAASLVIGLTAHYLTHSTYALQAGDTALIHAAAGGTGQVVVQMAKQRGARVIGTVSTEEKAALARQAGVDDIIFYTQTDFEAETKRLTNGKGVDVVYDSVGLTTFDKSLNCLRPRGYMVLFGQASGKVPPFDPQILNNRGSLFLTRPTLGHYIQDRAELLSRANDLFAWIQSGAIKVTIDQRYPLSEAKAAHDYLGGRYSKGKVVLVI